MSVFERAEGGEPTRVLTIIGAGEGLVEGHPALPALARHLAFGFRGVLSFWTAGELPDDELAANARDVANALLGGAASQS